MSSPALSVSLVICTCDRLRELYACLEAAGRLSPAPNEVIVVDNGSHGIEVRQAARVAHARYLREPVAGASRARNRGAREAQSEIVAFLDDDALPELEWLRYLSAPFFDPRVTVAVGRVQPPPASPDIEELHTLAGFADQGAMALAIDRDLPNWFEQVNFSGVGIAANMAIRRSAFDHWAGFDERLGPGSSLHAHEEIRAFCDLVAAGGRLMYAPDAMVQHPTGVESAGQMRQRYLKSLHSSGAYLMLLLAEGPCRYRTLAYLLRKIGAMRPLFGRQVAGTYAHPLAPWRVLLARIQGAAAYFRARLGFPTVARESRLPTVRSEFGRTYESSSRSQ